MSHPLQQLLPHLSPRLRAALSTAAHLARDLAHASIRLEHLFLALLPPPASDLATLLGPDTVALEADLHRALATLPGGDQALPDVDPILGQALATAWEHQPGAREDTWLRSGHLLAALVRYPALRDAAGPGFARLEHWTLQRLAERQAATRDCPGEALPAVSATAEALVPFTLDLTALAREGRLDPVLGREREIQQLVDILLRRRQNNPILVGDPGVGKTAVVEGLAQRIARGEVPSALQGAVLRTLDLGLLTAGASVSGTFEARLKGLLEAVRTSPVPVILFIDEAHTLVGAGAAPGQSDAANLLKPALARGELRTIAATTWREYRRHFEKDPALARRFQRVEVEEPGEVTALTMVQGMASVLEAHHGIRILPEVLEAAVHLSARLLPDRLLPDKALCTLDTACARVARRGTDPEGPRELGVRPLVEVLSDWTGLPADHIAQEESLQMARLEADLGERIAGQPEALARLARHLRAAQAGLVSPERPRGAFLLAGPAGVGKTATAQALADLLQGGARHLVTLDLGTFQEGHTVSTLKGAPPGYVGFGEGGVLTETVRRRPHAILLLERVDRAHPDILALFTHILDQGRLEDAEGRVVDFRQTLLLFTLRTPEGMIPDSPLPESLLPLGFQERLHLLPFRPLDAQARRRVIQQEMEGLSARLEDSHRIQLQWEPSLLEHLAAEPTATPRLDQSLLEALMDPLSPSLLAPPAPGSVRNLRLRVRKGRIQVQSA